jgi:predicted nucleic acid-binding protein
MTTRTPDTSVVLAGLSSWHADHDVARRELADRPPLIAAVLTEAYAVLTRLPPPRRVRPRLVRDALTAALPGDPIVLPGTALRALLDGLVDHNIAGGGIYDAVIAETARFHDLTLVSLDQRARPVYETIGVHVSMLD